MAIGDDLFTILGLIPVRDRAGIARGTMATEAQAAAGAAAQMEGPRPPAFTMPPQMLAGGGPTKPPPADVELPDDVPTEYASGKPKMKGGGGVPLVPIPQERVIESSPAAAPSPGVVRNSDIILAQIRKEEQARRMQQLFSSIGLIANAFNRNPESAHATRQGLAAGMNAGGGIDINTTKQLLEMRDKETDTERLIEHAKKTLGLTEADARALHGAGQLAGRFSASELREQEKIRRTEQVRKMLQSETGTLTALTGMNETALRATIHNDPAKLLDLVTPEKLETVRKARLEGDEKQAEQDAYQAEFNRALKDPSITKDQMAKFASPSAVKELFKQQAEGAGKAPYAAAADARNRFLDKDSDHDIGKAAEAYLKQTAPEIGRVWSDRLLTGTLADLRQSALWRPIATIGEKFGYTDKDLQDTAKLKSLLGRIVTENVKLIPGPASDKDTRLGATIAGSTENTPLEIRDVLAQTERVNRNAVENHNNKVRALRAQTPQLNTEFQQVRILDMPEPSKLLQDDLFQNTPQNITLRSHLREAHKRAEANPNDAKAVQQFRQLGHKFNQEFGAEMAQWYLNQERL